LQKNIALTSALLYALLAGSWILLSDYMLVWLSYSSETVAAFSLLKGGVFVLVSAIALYFLVRRFTSKSSLPPQADSASLTRQTKLLLTSLILLILAIPLLSTGVLYQRAPMVEAQAQKTLALHAQLNAHYIESWLFERNADALTMQRDPFLIAQLQAWLEQGDSQAKQQLEDTLFERMQNYQYEGIDVFEDGQSVMTIGRAHPDARSHLQPLIAQATTDGKIQTSQLYYDDLAHLHLDWVIPIRLAQREVTLILHAGAQRFFAQLLQQALAGNPYRSFILIGSGQDEPVLLSLSAQGEVQRLACRHWGWLAELRENGVGGFSADNCARDKVAFGYFALSGADWAVVTQQSLREAFTPLRTMMFWITLVSMALMLLLSLVLWLLWRQEQRMRALVIATEAAEKEALLDYVAHYDNITGLPNRALFMEQLTHKIKEALHQHQVFALLLFDLDRFKDINDSYGHQIGDVLLRAVADNLRREIDESVSLSRIGGDEFALIVQGERSEEQLMMLATEQAGLIAQVLNQPMALRPDLAVRVGVSIGICLFPFHAQSAARLMQFADAALYRAKADGKGRFAFYSDELTALARERVRQEANLKQAIFKQHLVLFYQPQVRLSDQTIVSAEALIRWQDPKLGLIAPAEFIPMAEETGLIHEIGDWVIQQVCQQGQTWLAAGHPPLRLAVNVSAQQFHNGQVIGSVKRALKASGFPPQYLEIELTESALMRESDSIGETLRALRDLGVSIALDDFGTGYSSLAYLKHFKLDVVKIDKSFIDGIVDSPRDAKLVQAIIDMAHALDLTVLAEGVETFAQFQRLQKQGCDVYQGYLISQALPAQKFLRLYLGEK
jgi:diguanylate cyclase (GGDEF)-like protein